MHRIKTLWAACTLAILLTACGDEGGEQVDGPEGDRLPWLTCVLQGDGVFALDFGFAEDRKVLVRGTLGAEDPNEQDAAHQDLREAMAAALEGAVYHGPGGMAVVTLRVEGAPGAQWRYAQRILEAAYHPTVRIARLDLRLMGEATGTRLDLQSGGKGYIWGGHAYYEEWAEEWVDAGAADEKHLTIKLLRKLHPDPSRTFTRIEVGDEQLDLAAGGRPSEAAYESSMGEVERALAAALEEHPRGTIEIGMPPPHGPRTPYGDVLRIVRSLFERDRRYFLFSDAGMAFRVR